MSRRQDILDFIARTHRARGYPPTIREIGEAVGLASPSSVHWHLLELEKRGFVRRDRPLPARPSWVVVE